MKKTLYEVTLFSNTKISVVAISIEEALAKTIGFLQENKQKEEVRGIFVLSPIDIE